MYGCVLLAATIDDLTLLRLFEIIWVYIGIGEV